MPGQDPRPPNPLLALRDAAALVRAAIALVDIGLEKNPSPGQERTLQRTRDELTVQLAELDARLAAVITRSRPVVAPTAAQVASVASLTGEVEKLTTATTTASSVVGLTGRVLALATEVTGDDPEARGTG